MKVSNSKYDPSRTAPDGPESTPPTIDTILLLEKVVQDQEQLWIENLNVLEHLIANIAENHLNANPDLIWKSNFVVRRLPTYLASCTNTNEYAILLHNFPFTLSPPHPGSNTLTGSTSSRMSRPVSQLSSSSSFRNSGPGQRSSGSTSTVRPGQQPGLVEIFAVAPGIGAAKNKNYKKCQHDMHEFIIEETQAYCSNTIFNEFARSFLDGFNKELARNSAGTVSDVPNRTRIQVQLLGPQLLSSMVNNLGNDKIFKLTQDKIPVISRSKVGKCSLNIDHAKSVITISLDETRVTVRPALFYNCNARPMDAAPITRLNKSIMERLPLHHPLFLNIAQALTKGWLLFPTNCETMWSCGYWPNEAHLLAYFHPSSVPSRILKLFSLYCLQPQTLLEYVTSKRSNSLLVLSGDPHDSECDSNSGESDDGEGIRLHSFSRGHKNGDDNEESALDGELQPEQLTVDFFVHCFLTELETAPRIEDWSPTAFPKRLHTLLTTAIDAVEKCFYPNYFIRTNLLKGYRKAHSRTSTLVDNRRVSANIQDFIDDTGFGEEDGIGKEDDDDTFTLGEIDLRHYAEIQDDDIAQRDIDFGIAFEELKIQESEAKSVSVSGAASPSTSNFHVVNPFASFQASGREEQGTVTSRTKRDTQRPGFGSLLKRLSSSLSKRSSIDETELQSQNRNADAGAALEGFEESVNKARRLQTVAGHLPPESTPPPPGRIAVASTSSYVNQGFDSQEEGAQGAVKSKREQLSQKESVFKIIIERLCNNELFYAVVTPPPPRPRHTPIPTPFRAPVADGDDDELEQLEHERAALMIHMEQARKTLYAQDELLLSWRKVVRELVRPKYICPHTFTPRQVQYIGLLVSWVIKCTNSGSSVAGYGASASATATWEISGDILRTVLYQMRSEPSTMLFKQKLRLIHQKNGHAHAHAGKSKSCNDEPKPDVPPARSQSMLARTLSSFVPQHNRGSYDICKTHHHHLLDSPESSVVNDDFETTMFGMDNPETATTHRLLQWLWQLRNSKIGRLSTRAEKYLELLHESSLVNSFFLEQWSNTNIMQALALKSAQAVTQIMSTRSDSLPAHVPLVAAWKRGWLWAEMVLSLVSWNAEKGIELAAQVPVFRQNDEGVEYVHGYQQQRIQLVYEGQVPPQPSPTTSQDVEVESMNPVALLKQLHAHSLEPDDNATTLAFHSEAATPIGWNDFEDPRRPGPWTVPILIYSSCGYYNQWEMVGGGGNIVQVMTRLQKFNCLQQVALLLAQPHKKTALNEIRKLSKSSAYKTFHFEGNVMTKTFRRLASLRNTGRGRNREQRRQEKEAVRQAVAARARETKNGGPHLMSCEKAGCPTAGQLPSSASIVGKTIVTFHNSREIECTKL